MKIKKEELKEGEIIKWKSFSNAMPIAIEYKIDY
jgi:hypothetical protein